VLYLFQIEEDPYTIEIKVTEPHKVGDGMGAYVVYKVITTVHGLMSLYVLIKRSIFILPISLS